MNNHDGFLNAINADPDDDTPRLIYADWLEDNGEPERAEFIRVQCRAASLPASDERDALEDRADDLLREHQRRWLAPLSGASHPEFHRGFLERVQMTTRQFLAQGEALFRIGPSCTLGLLMHRNRTSLDKILASGAGRRLTGLHLTDATPTSLNQIGDAPPLRRLELSNQNSGTRNNAAATEALARLMERSWFSRLKVLRISGWPFGDEEANTLARTDAPPSLRGIVLRETGITSRGVSALAASPVLSRLEVLELDCRNLSATELAQLASNLNALRALCLEGVDSAEKFYALRPLLHRLEWLSLNAGSPGTAGLRVLASLREPLRLDTLILRQCGTVTAAALRSFAVSPLGQRLRALDLGAAGALSEALLRSLLEAGGLRQVRGLSLAGNPTLGNKAADTLADWPGFRQLRWLDLAGTGINGSALCKLLASSGTDHLVRARVDSASLKGADLLRLLTGPGMGKMVELSLDCRGCSEADLRAIMKLPALPRLTALDLDGDTAKSMREELRASPLGQAFGGPVPSGGNARIAWVKRNSALIVLGPTDEEY